MAEKMASQRALQAIDPLVYEGHEILFNHISGSHYDSADPQYSWAVLTAFGTSKGVLLPATQLNLHMLFALGDMIALQGRGLLHETSEWVDGQHIVVPHFTHSSPLQRKMSQCRLLQRKHHNIQTTMHITEQLVSAL